MGKCWKQNFHQTEHQSEEFLWSEQKVFSKYMYRLPVYSERLTWTKIDMPVINFSVHVLTKFLLPVF